MCASSPSPQALSARSATPPGRLPHRSTVFSASSISLSRTLWLSRSVLVVTLAGLLPRRSRRLLRPLPRLLPPASKLLVRAVKGYGALRALDILGGFFTSESSFLVAAKVLSPRLLGRLDAVIAGGGGERDFAARSEEPNQRRLRCSIPLLPVEGLLSVLEGFLSFDEGSARSFSVSGDEGGMTSTSSASRHHLRRLVYRPQPSCPRRPSFHYMPVSSERYKRNEVDEYYLVVVIYPPRLVVLFAISLFGTRFGHAVNPPFASGYPAPF